MKVLDFGLAKALEGEHAAADMSLSPTISVAATRMGVILGTAAYMAPEQARGKAVDRRADIWAFGCVLYEMLTGKRAFEGEDVSDTLAAILRGEPDWSTAPRSAQRLLRACLEKDHKQRLQSIGDYRLLLDDDTPLSTARDRRPLVWLGVAALAAIAAVIAAFAYVRQPPAIVPLRRLSVPIPANTSVGFLALSPDARQLVMRLNQGVDQQLWIRPLDADQARLLRGTANARSPFWSPDSRSIGFFADGKLKTMPAGGGPAQALCDAGLGGGGTWNREGLILFGTDSGSIDRVQSSGGSCSELVKGEPGTELRSPMFLPDGRHFLYMRESTNPDQAGLYAASLDDRPGHRLLADVSSGLFAEIRRGDPNGLLLFMRDDRLMAQPLNAMTLQLGPDPVVVAENASFSLDRGQMAASVAEDGTLVYLNAEPARYQLTWFDRTGKQVGTVGSSNDRAVALSPDGRTVAVTRMPGASPETWLHDLDRDTETRLTPTAIAPVWAPGGDHFVFTSQAGDLYVEDVARGSSAPLLQKGNQRAASDWSRDGHTLVYTEVDPKMRADIWFMSEPLAPSDGQKRMPFLQTPFAESQARLSPDGRWIAYTSDESGRFEVYLQRVAAGAGKQRLSNNGGVQPAWRGDDRELLYLERGTAAMSFRMMSVSIAAGPDRVSAGLPRELFAFRTVTFVTQGNLYNFSPTSDASRFLVSVLTAEGQPTVAVLTGWARPLSATR